MSPGRGATQVSSGHRRASASGANLQSASAHPSEEGSCEQLSLAPVAPCSVRTAALDANVQEPRGKAEATSSSCSGSLISCRKA
eukprot:704942-Rhodomonas_salina.1